MEVKKGLPLVCGGGPGTTREQLTATHTADDVCVQTNNCVDNDMHRCTMWCRRWFVLRQDSLRCVARLMLQRTLFTHLKSGQVLENADQMLCSGDKRVHAHGSHPTTSNPCPGILKRKTLTTPRGRLCSQVESRCSGVGQQLPVM